MQHTHTYMHVKGQPAHVRSGTHRMYERMDALEGTQVEAHTDAEHAGAGFMCI